MSNLYLTNIFSSKLLHAVMVDGMFAPTTKQRLKYQTWLHVYGRQSVRITKRMAQLLEKYEVR